MSTEGLPVEPAQVIALERDGAPPCRIPISMTRGTYDAMVRRGDIKRADPTDERAWLTSVAIQIIGDKV